MTTAELLTQRLLSQQLTASSCRSAVEVVQWMGAMQAQEYDMAKWAIGARLPGSTEALVEEAINQGDIVRTHILRPTWHFVAASDIYWLLDLTAPHVRKLMVSANRKLELDASVFNRSNAIIEKALEGNIYLTRSELMTRLQAAGIRTDDFRSAHLMIEAELAGLVCNGPRRGKHATYALLYERVPVRRKLSREEALAELAKRYFTSHGPATLKDFAWWSGLTITELRRAIELAKVNLQSVVMDSKTYWFSASYEPVQSLSDQSHLLPAFDEFMVGYCDRSASLIPEMAIQVAAGNGIFRPIIVIDGQVIGSWKRTLQPKALSIKLTFFHPLSHHSTERIQEKARLYGAFVERNEVIIS